MNVKSNQSVDFSLLAHEILLAQTMYETFRLGCHNELLGVRTSRSPMRFHDPCRIVEITNLVIPTNHNEIGSNVLLRHAGFTCSERFAFTPAIPCITGLLLLAAAGCELPAEVGAARAQITDEQVPGTKEPNRSVGRAPNFRGASSAKFKIITLASAPTVPKAARFGSMSL
jgi:hypothetical protein